MKAAGIVDDSVTKSNKNQKSRPFGEKVPAFVNNRIRTKAFTLLRSGVW